MTTIVVIGPPSAGKGTRIEKTKEVVNNVVSISTGKLLRERGVDVSNGELVSDEMIMDILSEKLNSLEAEYVFLDGVPRNIPQAEKMKEQGIQIDKVIYLPISAEEAVERILSRKICSNPNCQETFTEGKSNFKPPKVKGICDKCGSHLINRSDDNEETIKRRLEVYYEYTEPVITWFENERIPVIKVTGEDNISCFIKAVTD